MTTLLPGGSLRPLHPHQVDSLEALRVALRSGFRSPVLAAPTGFGKTVVAAHIVDGIFRRDMRVVFGVPSLGLIDQTLERFVENGLPESHIGVIQGDHPKRAAWAPIQIATPQTLARRTLPQTDVLVVDECHIRYEIYNRWILSDERPKFVIGLSATPWAKGLGQLFDTLVPAISTQELINRGFLSPFRVFVPSRPNLDGIKTVAGDYHEGQLSERMSDAKLVGDITDTWLVRGRGRPTLCFCVDRNHARHLHDRFQALGVRVAYVDANTPRTERDEIGRDLARGEIEVVVNIGCLTTGIDWDVRCIILARPTKSEMLFVQIVGRGLRTAPGKDYCLILDHSDNHLRLGCVTDIHKTELCCGKPKAKSESDPKERITLPKACPHCTALVPAGWPSCPSCGHEMPKPPPLREEDGDLVEYGSDGKPVRRVSSADVLKKRPKAEVYAEIKALQRERGKSDGWAAHTYRNIFGVWPRNVDPSPDVLAMSFPSPELRQYVRSRNIAFARSMKAAGA